MNACKIICVLLVSIYYGLGHCMFRHYNNVQQPAFPTLNFRTFPEYFKPQFRIQNKYFKNVLENRIPHETNTKTQRPPVNRQRNEMLSMINKMLKPLMSKVDKLGALVKKPMQGRDTMNDSYLHGIHLKLIPKLVKKEVAKQMQTILEKRPIDKLTDSIKEEQNKTRGDKIKNDKGINKKDNTNVQFNVNRTSSDTYIQERGYINKIKANSIFGNFVGNKNFTNIFVFFPKNDNSPLVVGIKDNLTDIITVNLTDNSTEKPSDKFSDEIIEKEKEGNKSSEDLVGNKDAVSPDDNATNANKDNDAGTTIHTTAAIIPTSDAKTSTTEFIPINDNVTVEDEKNITNGENDLASNKDKEDENIESDNVSTEKEMEPTQVTTPDNSSTTEDSINTTTVSSTTIELVNINGDETTVLNKEIDNPSENLNDTKDESVNEDVEDDKVNEDAGLLPNKETEDSSESTNDTKDESVNEDKEDDKLDDPVKERDFESTTVSVTYTTAVTTEDYNVSTTEVLIVTENSAEITASTESESDVASENTTESVTTDLIETLSTSDEEHTTQNGVSNTEDDSKSVTTDSNDTAEDDYLDIEYTYF